MSLHTRTAQKCSHKHTQEGKKRKKRAESFRQATERITSSSRASPSSSSSPTTASSPPEHAGWVRSTHVLRFLANCKHFDERFPVVWSETAVHIVTQLFGCLPSPSWPWHHQYHRHPLIVHTSKIILSPHQPALCIRQRARRSAEVSRPRRVPVPAAAD